MPVKIPTQWMKVPSGSVHILRGFRIVQDEELDLQLLRVLGLNPSLRLRPEEIFDALMTEALDHTVYRISSVYTRQEQIPEILAHKLKNSLVFQELCKFARLLEFLAEFRAAEAFT
jgi:hypothetical protein